MPRRLAKMHAARSEFPVIALEIIGLKNEENPPAALVANLSELRVTHGFGQQQSRFLGTRRSHQQPAFVLSLRRVFHQLKAERLHVVIARFVVIAHQDRDGSDMQEPVPW